MVAVTLVFAFAGAGVGLGLCLAVDGLRRRPRPASPPRRPPALPHRWPRRLALAAGAGLGTLVLTRWPVAGAAVAGAGWWGPDLARSRREQDRETARTEAVAAWTEMLRDTMSGAHGLEDAVVTTAPVAPAAIAPEVAALAVRLERQPLDVALRAFAEDLAHPIGDLVVASLTLAARGSVGDLGGLLGTLAEAARDEAGMRLRIHAARARLRTAVRVIAACTAATGLGLVLLNRRYLHAYDTASGQAMLALVAACWAVALRWLSRLGRFVAPERLLAAVPSEAGR